MTNVFEIIQSPPGYFKIKGDLTFTSLTQKNLKRLDFSPMSEDLTIDLSEIDDTDSAALALIVEWLKHKHSHNKTITIINIPNELRILAKLCGLDISDPLHSLSMHE
jgi:phospholipid transport system transporter-binding protein